MRIELFDPTFRTMQREPPIPGTTGQVISVVDAGNYLYDVTFKGRTSTCRSAGKRELSVGDFVCFAETKPYPWIIKSDAEYPTRYRRPLAEFSNSKPASVFLSYLLRNNPKWFTYRNGTIAYIVDSSNVGVYCWDNVTREFPVEYPGETCDANEFDVGDPCLVYRKSENDLVVIGKETTVTTITSTVYIRAWDGVVDRTTSGVYVFDVTGGIISGIPISDTFVGAGTINFDTWADYPTPNTGTIYLDYVYNKLGSPPDSGTVSPPTHKQYLGIVLTPPFASAGITSSLRLTVP